MKRPDGSEIWVHAEDVKHRQGLGWKLDKNSSLYDSDKNTSDSVITDND